MQSLLGGTLRNYLPSDWATVQGLSSVPAAGGYPVLATGVVYWAGGDARRDP
jgi:hypothetical protein